jgi:large subunit ribosomal protein L32
MPVPKRKRSRARRDSRFANKGIKVKAIASCLNCKVAIVPHTACKDCGFYKGVKVLATKADRAVRRLAVKATKAPAKKASAESQAE